MVRYETLLFEKTAGQSQAGKSARHMRWRPGIGASRVIEGVSGFFEVVWANHFQQKKFAYGVDYANSRRGRLPSTR